VTDDAAHREWEMVIGVAQHFNDLLMRLRAFGLPLLGTIAGAGLTLGFDKKVGTVPDWSSGAFVGMNAFAVTLVVPYLLYARKWARDKKVPFHVSEQILWWTVPAIALAALGGFVYLCASDAIDLKDEHAISAGPLILFFALAVIVALYAVDRFYYYKLLMGAVDRATELEGRLGYEMTPRITAFIPPQEASSIVTLLYYLPGVLGYIALVVLVAFNPIIAA